MGHEVSQACLRRGRFFFFPAVDVFERLKLSQIGIEKFHKKMSFCETSGAWIPIKTR